MFPIKNKSKTVPTNSTNFKLIQKISDKKLKNSGATTEKNCEGDE